MRNLKDALGILLEGAQGFLRGLANFLKSLLGLPIRVAQSLSQAVLGKRGGRQEDSEPEAEQRAEKTDAVREFEKDQTLEGRVILSNFWKVALAKAGGKEPIPEQLATLPARLQAYVHALTQDECASVSKQSISQLRALIENRSPRTDVRSPAETEALEATNSNPEPPIDLSARRDALRAAARDAMRCKAPFAVAEVYKLDADLKAMGL